LVQSYETIIARLLESSISVRELLMHKKLKHDFSSTVLFDAFNSTGIGFSVFDAAGRLLHANDAWSAADQNRQAPTALQVPDRVACTSSLRGASRGGDESATRFLGVLERVFDGQSPHGHCEYLETRPEPRWFDITIDKLHDQSGFVMCSRDVTISKRAAAATATQIDELSRNTRAHTVSLLAAAAAHELSQPLSAILATSGALLMDVPGQSIQVDTMREGLHEIRHIATHATEIISRMRKLLRGSETERAQLNINTLIEEVVELLGNDILRRQVRVQTNLDPDAPVIQGDPIQLQQVLINLIVNAIDATASQPQDHREVQIETRPGGRSVEIHVIDRGPTLATKVLHRMFEPFFTTKRSGMGLGLYITRAIVESHGGAISAHNIDNHGVSMRVVLPALAPATLDQMISGIAL
jgi:signal transduction histidine kinase